jgi:DNA-binding transcriptional LysR family regulator
MRATVPESAIVYRVTDNRAMIDAVVNGAGIGFVSDWVYRNDDTLVEILPSQDDWGAPVWLVTHVDLHRTAKVQAFLTHLKARAKEWGL